MLFKMLFELFYALFAVFSTLIIPVT